MSDRTTDNQSPRIDLGLTRKLPNDYIALELESLSPFLGKRINAVLDAKAFSQAVVPDVVGGILLAHKTGGPPMPLSIHATAWLANLCCPGDSAFSIQARVPAMLAMTMPMTVVTRMSLAIPIVMTSALARFRLDNRQVFADEPTQSGRSSLQCVSTVSSLFPFLLETAYTKLALPDQIKEMAQRGMAVSSQLLDNDLISDFHRGQIDNAGRIVLSKHPFAKNSTKVGFFKKMHRIASWYFPIRRASFKVSDIVVKEKVSDPLSAAQSHGS